MTETNPPQNTPQAQLTADPRDATIAELQDRVSRLANELESRHLLTGSHDDVAERAGGLFRKSEAQVRLMSRDEQVQLSATALTLIKLGGEFEGIEVTPEYALKWLNGMVNRFVPARDTAEAPRER